MVTDDCLRFLAHLFKVSTPAQNVSYLYELPHYLPGSPEQDAFLPYEVWSIVPVCEI